jgi:hypothetical protein
VAMSGCRVFSSPVGGWRGSDDTDLARPLLRHFPADKRGGAVRTGTASGLPGAGPRSGVAPDLELRRSSVVNVPIGLVAPLIG